MHIFLRCEIHFQAIDLYAPVSQTEFLFIQTYKNLYLKTLSDWMQTSPTKLPHRTPSIIFRATYARIGLPIYIPDTSMLSISIHYMHIHTTGSVLLTRMICAFVKKSVEHVYI
jgi:hypothetical protein